MIAESASEAIRKAIERTPLKNYDRAQKGIVITSEDFFCEGGGGVTKDIELLKELKWRLVEKMVIDSRRTLVNVNVINKCGEYIDALSNAIQMMEEE